MKTLDQLETFLRDNIQAIIKEANNNTDCPGYGILMPNYSINTMDMLEQEDLDGINDLLNEFEQELNVTISVSDYDDLVIMTEKYSD